MSEYHSSNPESKDWLPKIFDVKLLSPKEAILKKVNAGFACAYLVDEEYNLLVGLSGKHADLIKYLGPGTKILQKGQIDGKKNK